MWKTPCRDVALINVYVPNIDQPKFLDRLSNLLMTLTDYPIILGGDFNCISNVGVDRSHPPLNRSPINKVTKYMKNWESRWNLMDSWRMLHPDERDYSFYSGVHDLHVRLDRIYCTPSLHAIVTHTEYLPRTCSDHNPLIYTLQMTRSREPVPTWHLKVETLEDTVFHDQLKAEIETYFSQNWGSTDSHLTEWEAFKVVARGCCINGVVGIRTTLIRGTTERGDYTSVGRAGPHGPHNTYATD